MFHNSIKTLISSALFNPRTSQSSSISPDLPLFLPAIQFIRQPDEEKELHHILILQMLTSDSLWVAGFLGYQVTRKSAYSDI